MRKMFSRPVSSGWKPVPTSSRRRRGRAIDARPVGRLGDPREDLEQRALAGAVAADDADALAVLDVEVDVAGAPRTPDVDAGPASRRSRARKPALNAFAQGVFAPARCRPGTACPGLPPRWRQQSSYQIREHSVPCCRK